MPEIFVLRDLIRCKRECLEGRVEVRDAILCQQPNKLQPTYCMLAWRGSEDRAAVCGRMSESLVMLVKDN